MARYASLLALALFLLPALAFLPAEARETPHVQDSPDDARVDDSGSRLRMAGETACRATYGSSAPVGQAVHQQTNVTPCRPDQASAGDTRAPSAGGSPAPGAMEALGAAFAETAQSLLVRLDVASLDEQFSGAVVASSAGGVGEAASGAIYSVCWTGGGSACSERAGLAALPGPQGVRLLAFFENAAVGCNDLDRCHWAVPVTLTLGSPGRIEWAVPRELLPNGTRTSTLFDPRVIVEQYYSPSGRMPWPAEDGRGYNLVIPSAPGGAEAPPTPSSTYGYVGTYRFTVDEAGPGRAFTFQTDRAPLRLDATFEALLDEPGDVAGVARADVDLLTMRLVETPTTLMVSLEVANVEASPRDHQLLSTFSLSSGRTFVWGYSAAEGIRSSFAQVCTAPGCLYSPVPEIRHIPMDLEVRDGQPGWINATFQRADLGDPPRSSMLHTVQSLLYTYADRETETVGRGGASVTVVSSEATDVLVFAPLWRFQSNTVRTVLTSGLYATDPVNDVADSRFVPKPGRFDLMYLEALGSTPIESRITIGLRDLSSLEVPEGVDAIFYGAGLELEDGRVFMTGFYRSRDIGPVRGTQQFLCAPDTTVLVPTKRDPADAVWTIISGAFTGTGVDVSGSGQAGALTLFVPHTCFGITEPGPLPVRRIAMGSYLILAHSEETLQDAGMSGPQELDSLRHDEPILLSAATIVPPTAPWWVEPFGIPGFWDLTGAGSAIIASVVGYFALNKRKRILQRYLDEIERIAKEHEQTPRVGERKLLAVRQRLKLDLLRNRVEHAHFSIIEKRLDETLVRARVRGVAIAFDELPHRLLVRLQDLLVDGRISAEDHRAFFDQLDETDLGERTKERIRRKLDVWLHEDRVEEAQRALDDESAPRSLEIK